MPISLDNIFGAHEQALVARSRRAELLASNLANADTPGFKARDVDFSTVMRQAGGVGDGVRLSATHGAHFGQSSDTALGLRPQYRVPLQPTVDGNTVDTQIEQTAFLENALAYQTTLTFLEQRISGLRQALRGE